MAAADADDAAREAAADAAAVVVGLEGICRGLGITAQRVLAAAPAEVGSEEGEYARRLTETVATVAANHVQVISDEVYAPRFSRRSSTDQAPEAGRPRRGDPRGRGCSGDGRGASRDVREAG